MIDTKIAGWNTRIRTPAFYILVFWGIKCLSTAETTEKANLLTTAELPHGWPQGADRVDEHIEPRKKKKTSYFPLNPGC